MEDDGITVIIPMPDEGFDFQVKNIDMPITQMLLIKSTEIGAENKRKLLALAQWKRNILNEGDELNALRAWFASLVMDSHARYFSGLIFTGQVDFVYLIDITNWPPYFLQTQRQFINGDEKLCM